MQAKSDFRAARERFAKARRAEGWYGRTLRKIAAQIDQMVRGFDFEDPMASSTLESLLERYAETIEPWAQSVGRRMITEVAARDGRAWFEAGQEMGRNLRREIATAPTGAAMTRALADQVWLITSLPREAAQRVHRLTTEALSTGRRAADIAGEILETGGVTRNRATLIARTEVSRTATELTSARAQYIGGDGYIWRTAGDADVRPLHRKLAGKFFKWNEPPVTGESGERSLPGAIYNCRCYPEVVIPERFLMAA